MSPVRLIVFSGLPGVGKTTLARDLANAMGAVFLRIDTVEEGIRASALRTDDAMDAGYVVAWRIARENLALGLTVVGDSVNPVPATRNGWRNVARQAEAELVEIEIICSDPAAHRNRVEHRRSETGEGPTWADVQARAYTPRTTPRIILDTATLGPDDALAQLIDTLLTDPDTAEAER